MRISRVLLCLFVVVLLGIVTAPIGLAAGEEEVEPEKPVLRFSHGYAGASAKAPVFEPALTEYITEVSDEVIIEPEYVSGTDRIEQVMIDVAAGDPPDVMLFWASEANIGDMAREGVLMDIDELIAESDVINRDDFTGWPTTNIDGTYYGIPYEAFSGFMLANRRLFDEHDLEIPETMEEFEEVSAVFRENDIIPFSMGSSAGDPGHLFFSQLVYQFENGFEDTEAMYDTRDFDYYANRRAAETVHEFIEMNAFPDDTVSVGGWDEQLAPFTEGRAAMIFTFPWITGTLVSDGDPEDYEVMRVPKHPDAVRDPGEYTVGGISQQVCVSREAWENESKREHILEFVEWLVADEMFAALAEDTGMEIPKDVDWDMEGLTDLEREIIEVTSEQELLPMHEEYFHEPAHFDYYKSAIDELYAGRDVDAFIADVDEFINE